MRSRTATSTDPVYAASLRRSFPTFHEKIEVIKLRWSVYRLKDAGRVWNQLLINFLTDLGLAKRKTVPYVFIRDGMVIVCYVEELFLFARQNSLIDRVGDKLGKKFWIKDLGKLKKIINMDLKCPLDDFALIEHSQVADKVLKDTGRDEWRLEGSPIDPSVLTNRLNTKTLVKSNPSKYRNIVESLINFTPRTRPDLIIAASLLAFYLHIPTSAQMVSATRAQRYLSGTLDREMKINVDATTQLTAYIDPSWGSEIERSRRILSEMLLL